MANRHRGEIDAVLDGHPFRLVLTLAALAELESAFGDTDMLALAERFGSGRLSARDAQAIIGAGLRGGGHDISDEAVGAMRAEGAAGGFVDIVARLLNATFGSAEALPRAKAAESEAPVPRAAPAQMAAPAEGRSVPFPGAT